jgi:hypothetical protein
MFRVAIQTQADKVAGLKNQLAAGIGFGGNLGDLFIVVGQAA